MKKLAAIVLAVSLGGCANVEMTREEMLVTAAGAAAGPCTLTSTSVNPIAPTAFWRMSTRSPPAPRRQRTRLWMATGGDAGMVSAERAPAMLMLP